MLEQRTFGIDGLRVSEVGVSLAGRNEEIAREARRAGVDIFHLDDSDDFPWLAEVIGPVPATVLISTQGPPVGGTYRTGAPDRHLTIMSYSSFTTQNGALGPFRVFGGWEVGTEGDQGPHMRLHLASRVMAEKSSQAFGVTYTPKEQAAGLEFFRVLRRGGLGVVAP